MARLIRFRGLGAVWFRVSSFGFRVLGFGFRVSVFGYVLVEDEGRGFDEGPDCGFRVWGSGFGV